MLKIVSTYSWSNESWQGHRDSLRNWPSLFILKIFVLSIKVSQGDTEGGLRVGIVMIRENQTKQRIKRQGRVVIG